MPTYADITAQLNQSISDADREAKVLELVRKLQMVEPKIFNWRYQEDMGQAEVQQLVKTLALFISDPRVTNEVNRILND